MRHLAKRLDKLAPRSPRQLIVVQVGQDARDSVPAMLASQGINASPADLVVTIRRFGEPPVEPSLLYTMPMQN